MAFTPLVSLLALSCAQSQRLVALRAVLLLLLWQSAFGGATSQGMGMNGDTGKGSLCG